MNETMSIKKYIRDNKGRPIGVLVAVKTSAVCVSIGYSLCHKNDQFNKKKGTLIATNRATSNKVLTIPETVERYMDNFAERAGNYFFPEKTPVHM